ncbi:TPA: hypothetical protein ACH3X1_012356 [Trebouxia sp. C0004]
MKFIPRRRLVLSRDYASNSEAHWPSSQLPWDAEEAASAEIAQEVDWSSQLASQTQAATFQVPLREHRLDDMQAEHQTGPFSTHTEDQWTVARTDGGATQYAEQPSYPVLQPSQQCQIALPVSEYTEVYNFLTKGTGLVQPASLKEGALYRLSDLRQDEDRRAFSEYVEAPLSEAECHVSSVQHSHADTQEQSQLSTLPAGHYQDSSGHLQLQTGPATLTKASSVCNPSQDDLTQAIADDLEQPPSELSLSAVRPFSAHHQVHSMRSASTHDIYSSWGNEHLRSHQNLRHINYAASHLQLSQHQHLSLQAGSLQQLQNSHNPNAGSLNRLPLAPSQMLAPSVLTSSALQADIELSDTSHALQQPPDSAHSFAKPLHHALWQKQAGQVGGSQPVPALRADSSATAAAVRQPLLFPIGHQTVSVSEDQRQGAPSSKITSDSCQANTASLGMTVKAASMIPPSEQYQTSTQRTDLQGWKRAKLIHKALQGASSVQGVAQHHVAPDVPAPNPPQPDNSHPLQPTVRSDALACSEHALGCSAANAGCEQSVTACRASDLMLNAPGLDTCSAVYQHVAPDDSMVNDNACTNPAEVAALGLAADHGPLSDHPFSPEADPGSSSLHPDCPQWLPQHVSQIQLSYTVAEQLPGLPGTALLGQRVAFVLLEDFQQHDSRKETDTLLAGLHTGIVVQAIGQGHQPDMCQPSCTGQHHFFYVRVCPTHSQTVKPGSKRKRRLDLKMDLSSANCKGCFQELVQLDKAQLEDVWILVAPLADGLSPKPCAEHAREIATKPAPDAYAQTCRLKRDATHPTQLAKGSRGHDSTQSFVKLTDKDRGRGGSMGRGRGRDRGRGRGRGRGKYRSQTGNNQETDGGNMTQGSHNQATVKLFGTGLKTEVAACGLTAFADGCADKCQQLHSDLGRQAVRLAHTAQTAGGN